MEDSTATLAEGASRRAKWPNVSFGWSLADEHRKLVRYHVQLQFKRGDGSASLFHQRSLLANIEWRKATSLHAALDNFQLLLLKREHLARQINL